MATIFATVLALLEAFHKFMSRYGLRPQRIELPRRVQYPSLNGGAQDLSGPPVVFMGFIFELKKQAYFVTYIARKSLTFVLVGPVSTSVSQSLKTLYESLLAAYFFNGRLCSIAFL